MTVEKHMVPTVDIRPIILDWCRRNGEIETMGGVNKMEARTLLAERSGIQPAVLGKILNGSIKAISFDQADRLLCTMESVEEWYGRLAEWYYPPGSPPSSAFRHAQAFLRGETVFTTGEIALLLAEENQGIITDDQLEMLDRALLRRVNDEQELRELMEEG